MDYAKHEKRKIRKAKSRKPGKGASSRKPGKGVTTHGPQGAGAGGFRGGV